MGVSENVFGVDCEACCGCCDDEEVDLDPSFEGAEGAFVPVSSMVASVGSMNFDEPGSVCWAGCF